VPARKKSVKTLIVDGSADFRRRVRECLVSEADIEIVGEAADGQEAIYKARQLRPDLVLMDVRIPGLNGVDTLRCLKKELPATPIIILTMFELPVYKETVEANGASGYVIKRSMIETLLPTIREVCSGKEKGCPGRPN
jgi:DNA-binding NarL/FixJ family response regulator